MEITKEDLLNLIEEIIRIAKNGIMPKLRPNEDLDPCLFVTDSEKEVIGIAQVDLPETHEQRVHVDEVLRKKLKEMQAGAYAFTMMGWMVELPRNESSLDHLPPSQHPRRVEVFMVTAGSKMACTSKMYEVIRDRKKKIADLKDRTPTEASQQYGLFIDMLGSETPAKGQQH